MHDYFTKF